LGIFEDAREFSSISLDFQEFSGLFSYLVHDSLRRGGGGIHFSKKKLFSENHRIALIMKKKNLSKWGGVNALIPLHSYSIEPLQEKVI